MKNMSIEKKKARVKSLTEKVQKMKDITSDKALIIWEMIDDLSYEIELAEQDENEG